MLYEHVTGAVMCNQAKQGEDVMKASVLRTRILSDYVHQQVSIWHWFGFCFFFLDATFDISFPSILFIIASSYEIFNKFSFIILCFVSHICSLHIILPIPLI